jgi:hypothetical protein
MQFQTQSELWRLSYDAREMQFVWLEVDPEEEGWTVKAAVTVAIADLEDVVEVRTPIEVRGEDYHRLQVAVVLTGGRRIFLFSDIVGVDAERPWRDSREEQVVLAGVAALQEEIRGLIKG